MKNSDIVYSIYSESNFLTRIKQKYRESICSFEPIEDVLPKGRFSMLDIGCGSGWFGLKNLINNNDIEYVGVDCDSSAIESAIRARDKAISLGLLNDEMKIDYFIDVGNLADGQHFDVIILIDVLHHVKKVNLNEFFSKILSRLSVDGVLIIKDMNSSPLLKMAVNQVHDLVLSKEWIEHIPQEYLVHCLSPLRCTSITEYQSKFYSHYLHTYKAIDEY
ncbi:class I SAM-dependent methyltransferase [Enterovibrio calviensis]|uniref:class I SAM-dependent methyltransferase n=1 Tax=Enterovibrio calviensis TaxID=91359 RepID=UPI003735552C